MPRHPRSRGRERFGPESLLERARRWSDAHVTFDRTTDVGGRCPHCDGLVNRRLGPGVLCATCGRLWVVRELLEREVGLPGAA
jgi:ribosomal protein L37AE/L43A